MRLLSGGWSRKLGIVCVVRRIDIRAKAREERKGIEETGRAARQAFFSELALALDKQLAVPVGRRHESPWDTI